MSDAENTPMEPIDVKPVLPLVPSAASDTYADCIFKGARFRDFHHFLAGLKAYQEKTFTVYTVDGSALLRDSNHPELVEKYRYSYAIFKCQHFGKSRKRGKGERQHVKTLKLKCDSYMRLKLNRETMDMEISVLVEHHNHVCAPPQLDAKGRKILPQVIENSPEAPVVQRAMNNRPTPYSRPARAPLAAINRSFPMASGQNYVGRGESSRLPPTPRRVSQMFEYMHPDSETARVQKLRVEMLEHLAVINTIPMEEVELRNATARKLVPLIKKFLPNSFISQQWEELAALRQRME
uniref:Protein FAR1-RELATED SEQUENCE n=1 Tax=Panagrellus redivivus TaxID=6233 RepID=A0A7E4W2D0_PANRE